MRIFLDDGPNTITFPAREARYKIVPVESFRINDAPHGFYWRFADECHIDVKPRWWMRLWMALRC